MRSPTGSPATSKKHWQHLVPEHVLIKPRHPWQNRKAERFNQILQEDWAYRQAFTSNQARTEALQPWLHFYNNHTGPTAASEANHPSAGVTNLLTEYI